MKKLKLGNIFFTVIFLTFITISSAMAYVEDDILLEGTYGSGDNSALLVVDFWPGNGQDDSFAFLANFSTPSVTGFGLLDIVADNDTNFSYAESDGFFTDIWYTDSDNNDYHTTYDWPTSWWSYWISDDYGETWGFSGSGASGQIVSDGDTNGWLGKSGSDWTSEPVTPVPVPAAVWLIGSAFLCMMGIRRKK